MAKAEQITQEYRDTIVAREVELRNQSTESYGVNPELHMQQLRDLHLLYRLNPWLLNVSDEHWQIFDQLQQRLDPVGFGTRYAKARYPQTSYMRASRITS